MRNAPVGERRGVRGAGGGGAGRSVPGFAADPARLRRGPSVPGLGEEAAECGDIRISGGGLGGGELNGTKEGVGLGSPPQTGREAAPRPAAEESIQL